MHCIHASAPQAGRITSAECSPSNSSATRMSVRPWSTRMCSTGAAKACAARLIRYMALYIL